MFFHQFTIAIIFIAGSTIGAIPDIAKTIPYDLKRSLSANEELVMVFHQIINVALTIEAPVKDKLELLKLKKVNIPYEIGDGL